MDKVLVIRTKLEHDDDFLRKCLLKLFEKQEDDEQFTHNTNHDNGVGFNKADAGLLSTAANLWKPFGGVLPAVMLQQTRDRMLKYARQLSTFLTQEEIDS